MPTRNKELKRPKGLPEWKRPPLDEVAIAIQFREIGDFQSVHFGELFEEYKRHGFGCTEDQHPIDPKYETFGKTVGDSIQLRFHQGPPPLRRVWFMNDDDHELVQVQQDRFIYNWRKIEGSGEYRRFDNLYPKFEQNLAIFREFLKERQLGDLEIDQCELSYFNVIEIQEGESFCKAFDRVFKEWSENDDAINIADVVVHPEMSRFRKSYRINSATDSSPVARVHVNADPAQHENTKQQVVKLQIVFRGPPFGQSDQDLFKLFAIGRESIVRIFDSIISEECHKAWGRN